MTGNGYKMEERMEALEGRMNEFQGAMEKQISLVRETMKVEIERAVAKNVVEAAK